MSAGLLGDAFGAEMPSHVAKLVLLKLVDAAEEDGTRIYPAVATIARAAQCSRRHVQRTLRQFETVRLLCKISAGGTGPGDTAEYHLDVGLLRRIRAHGWAAATGQEAAPLADGDAPPSGGEKGDTMSPMPGRATSATDKGDISDQKGRHQMSPNPSLPLQDPSKEERESAGARDGQAGGEERATASDREAENAGPDHIADRDVLDALIRLHPQGAHDTIAAIAAPWRTLTRTERRDALDNFPSWLTEKGKRSAIAGLPTYLADRMFQRVKAPPAAVRATAMSAWAGPFGQAWWALFFDFVARHKAELVDRDSAPSGLLRKRVSAALQYAIGWKLDGIDTTDLDKRVGTMRGVPKDGREAEAWRHRLGAIGVALPIPDKAGWIYVPAGEAADWMTGAPLLEASEIEGVM